MNLLVTAGNTLVPIDRVRGITNIFTGRTGTRIALHAQQRGHHVTLLTSHPEVAAEEQGTPAVPPERWSVWRYRTFEDLQSALHQLVRQGGLDGIIHCAAVSDYQSAGIYAPDATTHFRIQDGHWESSAPLPPRLVDRSAGKVKSDEPELWLRLVRTPKLIDRIRFDWGFRGLLVKFKLEVGISEEELLAVAERSRGQSAADLMVANTLEGAPYWAYLGPLDGTYQRVNRAELAGRLLDAVERVCKERDHG
jgi:phosphopantothenoylcysteine synthetase/decarboxylase